jgi:HlyD family secretion protein
MKKRLLIAGITVVVLAAFGYVEFLRGNTQKYEFRFDKLTEGDMSVYVTATGTISAVISVDVGTQVSGIVTKLYADFNSEVKAGQLIAMIDTTFLYQSLKDAEANLDKAQAQLDDSRRNLVREKALIDRGLDAQLNYDAALTTNESNEAAVKSAQATLDRAKINLAYATIYAPIDGVVVNRAVNVGQTVAASFSSPTLFTIANDLRQMQVQTTVDESDVGRVSVGQQAVFTVDAYPDDKFTGTVSQIRLAPQSIQNVVNYIVVIDVRNDELKLMPGMTANVKILVANSTNVLKVSNMALRFQPPSELIDTTGAGGMRGRFTGSGEGSGDSSKMGRSSLASGDSQVRTGTEGIAGGGNFQMSAAGMERMRILRDSIQAAHGGKLSQEELRVEMRKIFASSMNRQNPEAKQSKPALAVSKEAAKFGIVSSFPEYQKSGYVPSHQSGRGRLWILEPSGRLKPVFVRTGLNDGRYTEISSLTLKAGDQIVLGASARDESTSSAGASPLTGAGQQRPGGPMR